ncbi:unnamed protein product [Strongylus vulgaris]|uniref:Uncharacterized protein n=1 Tax=Strongylus vulgaris TaxID=40348 RepID=A0A3P7HZF1_STRVU|nr:unnamed protein product [Strongylus vulgaris]
MERREKHGLPPAPAIAPGRAKSTDTKARAHWTPQTTTGSSTEGGEAKGTRLELTGQQKQRLLRMGQVEIANRADRRDCRSLRQILSENPPHCLDSSNTEGDPPCCVFEINEMVNEQPSVAAAASDLQKKRSESEAGKGQEQRRQQRAFGLQQHDTKERSGDERTREGQLGNSKSQAIFALQMPDGVGRGDCRRHYARLSNKEPSAGHPSLRPAHKTPGPRQTDGIERARAVVSAEFTPYFAGRVFVQ